jgi:hypothetical protein
MMHTKRSYRFLWATTVAAMTLISAPFMSSASAQGTAPASSAPSSPAPGPDKPNILVIFGDDIGQSNISAYSVGLMGYKNAARRIRSDEFLVVLWVIGSLRLFFGIQVIEISEKRVEAMLGRQEFVPVAQVVFAELAGRIAERLQRAWAMVMSRGCRPTVAPGMPTLQSPVRRQTCPVMKVERPAVQLFSA